MQVEGMFGMLGRKPSHLGAIVTPIPAWRSPKTASAPVRTSCSHICFAFNTYLQIMLAWDNGPTLCQFWSPKQWQVTLALSQVAMSCLNLVKTIHLFTKSSMVRPSCNVEPELSCFKACWASWETLGWTALAGSTSEVDCGLPRGLRSAGRSAGESARPHKDLPHLGCQRWGCPLNVALWDFCSAAWLSVCYKQCVYHRTSGKLRFSHVAKAIQNPNQTPKSKPYSISRNPTIQL